MPEGEQETSKQNEICTSIERQILFECISGAHKYWKRKFFFPVFPIFSFFFSFFLFFPSFFPAMTLSFDSVQDIKKV